ncbi:hypothetical protein EPUS_06987 [Endocarpon pusillum Z07020]|uniref:Uncharacterized protein n=1 Tax=Endocarpon pusillum (strain Z07020 / HMAS-L-300199) TaxID=1263415 RepID=U1HXA5_ENDPU|nr:uncharacterized protein EPUS_06987 [Endocarpon pusillum Z07020]ERF75455.1 hypothetical protein EPUS_06987 [Endocarpon pusillum Z07020]
MDTTKWFNLPGDKEAYIQDIKLRWVDDANLSIPWVNFYLRSAANWDFFALTFPDQAWILRQIQLIDWHIEESLGALEKLMPRSCKPQSWVELSNDHHHKGRDFVASTVFAYYRNPAAMTLHQQAVMLHYAKYLDFERWDESESDRMRMQTFERWDEPESDRMRMQSDRMRMQTFNAACVELVEGACLKDRARLVEELLSAENTAALLSVQPATDMPIWIVRREVVKKGLMIKKAMQQMRDALKLEEEEEEEEEGGKEGGKKEKEKEKDSREDDIKTRVLTDLDGKKGTFRVYDSESDDRCPTPRNVAAPMDADESRRDLPVLGCSNCGTILETNANETEGDWASLMEEDDSHSC